MPITVVPTTKTLLHQIQVEFSGFPYSGGAGLSKVTEAAQSYQALGMILENLKTLSRLVKEGGNKAAMQERELTELKADVRATRRVLGFLE